MFLCEIGRKIKILTGRKEFQWFSRRANVKEKKVYGKFIKILTVQKFQLFYARFNF